MVWAAVTSVRHGGRPASARWFKGKRVLEKIVGGGWEGTGHGIDGPRMNFYPLELLVHF